MLTSVARINIYSSSKRLTRSLLFNSSIPFNTHQYYHSENQPQLSHYLVSFQSWKLTHQPHEPNLHWNSRFRQQQQIETDESDQSSENWDLWFQQHQRPSLLPFSQRNNLFSQDQLYFLDQPDPTPMSKRPRESPSSIEIPNKRERYSDCKFSTNSFRSIPKSKLF
jgi:hypothetical protein